jgi:hypothetical protein
MTSHLIKLTSACSQHGVIQTRFTYPFETSKHKQKNIRNNSFQQNIYRRALKTSEKQATKTSPETEGPCSLPWEWPETRPGWVHIWVWLCALFMIIEFLKQMPYSCPNKKDAWVCFWIYLWIQFVPLTPAITFIRSCPKYEREIRDGDHLK